MFFELQKTDGTARACRLKTAHSEILTPVFMPVGTAAAVKSLDCIDLQSILNPQIILANTYHLYLRPTSKKIAKFGGLHGFTGFKKSFLTDSGGFQAFSLRAKQSEEGIVFKSHIDGSTHIFTPQNVLQAQYDFNSDIMMILDDLVGLPATTQRLAQSVERTVRWAKEAIAFHKTSQENGVGVGQNIFGIVQGGTNAELRRRCASELCELDFDGIAIGGLSVGESNEEMYECVERVTPFIDPMRPRYLMGVGTPEDIVENVARGVDMFDCVMPTRNARNGTLFTSFGKLNIKNAAFADETSPIDPDCDCYACKNFSRAYLNHLFRARELTFFRLASLHNLHYYLNLTKCLREAILAGEFEEFRREFYLKRGKNYI